MDIYKIFNSKYKSIDLTEYFKFIENNSLSTKIKFKTENHHILPVWAFPEYKSFKKYEWNKAILLQKDHFRAHLILCKLWATNQNLKTLLLFNDTKNEENANIYAVCKENMAYNMSIFQLEKSKLGLHPWQSEKFKKRKHLTMIKQVQNGIHPFQNIDLINNTKIRNNLLLSNGTHNFQKYNEKALNNASIINNIKLENGTHPFQQKDLIQKNSARLSEYNKINLENGAHYFKSNQHKEERSKACKLNNKLKANRNNVKYLLKLIKFYKISLGNGWYLKSDDWINNQLDIIRLKYSIID